MEIFRDIQGLRHYLRHIQLQEKSIGFVPTMGALHDGHLELIKTSMAQNNITVCSIFVNPTQFNNPADLEKYPRDTPSDIAKLSHLSCDVVFIPNAEEMYDNDYSLNINFGYLEEIMEGKFRPGHFKGVGVIIAKLFNVVKPDKAYFGKKDLQQLTIIKKIAKILLFDIEIIPVETVRESDGLAMSSRNTLLTNEERKHATDLIKALKLASEKLTNQENVESTKNFIKAFFDLESTITLEYFEIVNTDNLQSISEIHETEKVSLCIAGHLGKVRLIDNVSLN